MILSLIHNSKNKDVANHYAWKQLTPDEASKVIADNIKLYLQKIQAMTWRRNCTI